MQVFKLDAELLTAKFNELVSGEARLGESTSPPTGGASSWAPRGVLLSTSPHTAGARARGGAGGADGL